VNLKVFGVSFLYWVDFTEMPLGFQIRVGKQ
jgi:hypothetical protein